MVFDGRVGPGEEGWLFWVSLAERGWVPSPLSHEGCARPAPAPPSCRIHALPSAPIATAQGVLLNHPFLYAQELTPGGPAWRAGAGAPHQSAVPDLPAAPTGTARHSKHTHSIALCLLPTAEDVSSIPTTSEPPVPSTGEPRLLRAPTPTPSLHRVELSRVRRATWQAGRRTPPFPAHSGFKPHGPDR